MRAREIKCTVEGCGETGDHGVIKGKPYCRYHYEKFVITKPLVREQKKLNRNAECMCGSGKKYKNCCLKRAPHSSHYYTNLEKQAM